MVNSLFFIILGTSFDSSLYQDIREQILIYKMYKPKYLKKNQFYIVDRFLLIFPTRVHMC